MAPSLRILLVIWLLVSVVAAQAGTTCVAHPPRLRQATKEFKVRTGYADGRPGWVIDHIVPLCCGGRDDQMNMLWQPRGEAKMKDRFELDCTIWRERWPEFFIEGVPQP